MMADPEMEEEGEILLDMVQGQYPLPVKRVISQHPCVTERYFRPYFYVPSADLVQQMAIKSTGRHVVSDQCVLFHSNRWVDFLSSFCFVLFFLFCFVFSVLFCFTLFFLSVLFCFIFPLYFILFFLFHFISFFIFDAN